MQIEVIKLSELVRPEKNMRIHTEQQLKEFERSIKMFGQIRPIVVDENNVILAGNGLYETLLKMGKETAEVYRYTNLTANQKKKLMIADNKIFTLGIENLATLNSFLEDLKGDLDIPGYDEELLNQMVSDADSITEKLSEYGTLDESEINTIKESANKKESRIQQAIERTAKNEPSEPLCVGDESDTDNEPEGEQADIKRFIVCPKCGEKVWL